MKLPGMRTSLWRHQAAAYEFQRGKSAAMLALEMGCGKSAVAVAESLNHSKSLILCPSRVVQVWPEQYRRHCEEEMVVVALDEHAGDVRKRTEIAQRKLELAQVRKVPFVAIVNYEAAWREPFATWAAGTKANPNVWGLIVCDESHRVKDPKGATSKFVSTLLARKRLALTGTPMPHSPLDIFAQYRFLDRTIYGQSFFLFKQRYAILGGFEGRQVVDYANLDELHRKMYQIAFRVGKEVLDLPEEMDVVRYCDLGAKGLKVYRGLEEDMIAGVESGVITVGNALVKLLRLQQVTGGFVRTDVATDGENVVGGDVVRVDDAKAGLLADILEDLDAKEPVVVFCRFHSDLDTVHEVAKGLKRESLELSGRRDELKAWQAGGAPILAVQQQAGGSGVDCTRARYSIFFSLSWSNGDYRQARARTHRPGQTRPVVHVHLAARGTIDERILQALNAREEVVKFVLDDMRSKGGKRGSYGTAAAA